MLLDKTIEELSTGLKQKLFSIEELVQECYENIQKYNPKLNAFITIINKKEALVFFFLFNLL